MTQFSLFGAEAAAPTLEDLDGLLLAGGQWVRSAAGARLSVLVADRWRAEALQDAFRERDVAGADTLHDLGGRFAARTDFRRELVAGATRWTRGARLGVPAAFLLSPGGLRLWAMAAGGQDESGYLLATPASGGADGADGPLHRAAGAQLARLGVAGISLSHRPGPGWRITSARRRRRLAELVGPAPDGAGPDWP